MASIKIPSRQALSRGIVLSGVLAAVGYLGFSLWAGWSEVLHALGMVGAGGVVLAVALSLINYGLRFVRWQIYLSRLGHRMGNVDSALIYFSGFALTTTPGKAGELLRGVFLERRGMPFSSSIAALLSERLSDMIAIIVIGLPGLSLYPPARPVAVLCLVMIFIFGFVVLYGRTLETITTWISASRSKTVRALRHLLDMLIATRKCYTTDVILMMLPLSLAAWSAEAFAFHLVLERMGADVGLWTSMSIYALGMLVGGISFMPGGLGSTEAVMTALLVITGVSSADSVAATIIIRLTTLWFAVFLGLVVLLVGRRQLMLPTQQLAS
jgi:uncharacterized protein (TIRG00374 family)